MDLERLKEPFKPEDIKCTEPCEDIENMEFCCINCEQLFTCSGYCKKAECEHNYRVGVIQWIYND